MSRSWKTRAQVYGSWVAIRELVKFPRKVREEDRERRAGEQICNSARSSLRTGGRKQILPRLPELPQVGHETGASSNVIQVQWSLN